MAPDLIDGPNANEPPPRGFTSAAGKRLVLRVVFLVGGILVALQIVVPMISMFAMIRTMFEGLGEVTRIDPSRGALWEGSLWLVESKEKRGLGKKPLERRPEIRTRLLKWSPVGGGQPDLAVLPAVDDARLLAIGDALWAIGETRVVKMTRAGIEQKAISTKLENRFSALFSQSGRPSAIVATSDAALDVFSLDAGGAWRPADERGSAPVVGPWTNLDVENGIIVMPPLDGSPDGATVAGMCSDGIAVERFTGFAAIPCADWTPVGERGARLAAWTAARVAGKIAVFTARADGLDFAVEGFVEDGKGAWQRFFETRVGLVSSLGAFDAGDGRRFFLAIEGLPGAVTVHEIDGSTVARSTKLTTSAEMDRMRRVNALSWASNVAAVLTPFALLIALAVPLRRHRVPEYVFEGRAVRHAPLWRRCLAGAVDTLLAFGPVAAVYMAAFVFSDMQEEGAGAMVEWLAWIGVASLWSLAWLFVFSWLEGRLGTSPGKRLLALRVLGLDLEPCGFGRALLRNLSEFVDAFFGYAVGIALVALTPNRQRLGDLAAKTVVVFLPRNRG
jgi:uncharacterized RDD family membrane protein YckC